MTGHSRFFSPSALSRRIACTGSALMEDGRPDEASDYARWGTAAHSICERCVEGGDKEPADWLGKEIEGVTVDREMVDACETALAWMREVTAGAEEIECERGVRMPGVEDMFGTIDVLVDVPFGRLVVADYKFGAGVKVNAEDNPQLMAYAIMAAGEALPTYSEIVIAVIQPRAADKPDIWTITPSTLERWRNDVLLPTVGAIRSGKVEYHPSPDTCRWCKGANDCPAYAQAALELARLDFAGTPEIQAERPAITPELVARVYPQLELLEDFISRVRAMALDMASAGNLPGYKLVEGRGRREWIDEDAVIAILKDMGQDPYEHKVISPAKTEKLGKEVKEAVKRYVKRLPGNPVVAPEDDKRRAISTAAEDFAEITNP